MTDLNLVKDQLSQARHVVVLTGAGMSQESGLPTYRSASDGLWNQYVMEEVATAQALRQQPEKVWQWLHALAQKIGTAAPHAGHLALAQLARQCQVTIVTQNVDDLHERAGSTEVIHLHGSISAFRCVACARAMTLPVDSGSAWADLRQQVRCGHCNGYIRFDVVLFNEMLDHSRIDSARKAIRDSDVVLVVGTSNLIYPAAELPVYAMKRYKFVAEINPQETPLSSRFRACIRLPASMALPAMVPER